MDLLTVAARFTIDKTEYDRAMDEASRSAQEFGSDFDSTADDISGSIDSLEGDYGDLSDAMKDTASEADSMDGSLGDVSASMGDAASEAAGMQYAIEDAASGMSDAAGEAEKLSYGLGGIEGESSNAGDSLFNMGDIAGMVAGIFTGDFSGAISDAIDKVKEMATAVWDGVKGLAEYGDEIDKQSQKLGISSDAYQEWEAVLQHSGTNIGSLRRGMMQLSTAMNEIALSSEKTIDYKAIEKAKLAYDGSKLSYEEAEKSYKKAVKQHGKNSLEARKAAQKVAEAENKAREAYEEWQQAMDGTTDELSNQAIAISELGVQVTDANGKLRAQEDVFKDVIFALQGIESESARAAAAQAIFGRSAQELGPLLNTSAEETQGMIDRVNELGGVLSEDTVKASAAFQDSMQDMKTAADGIKNMFLEVLLPAATWVIDRITDVLVGFRNFVINIGPAIGKGVDKIGKFFTDTFGGLIEAAKTWGQDIINNFINGINDMWESAKNTVSDFAGMIKSFLGFSEPERGPLSNFHTYAPDMVKLFADGIEQNKALIADAVDDAFSFQPTIAANTQMAAGQEFTVPRTAQQAVLDIRLMLKETEIGRALVPYIDAEHQRYGVSLAGGGY